MKPITATIFLSLLVQATMSQQVINLYDGVIPNSKPNTVEEKWEETNGIMRVSNITKPTITPYLLPKDKANGSAVIIFPGGGYRINAISHEGTDVAKKLNEWGITTFVVKYRIPDDATMQDKEMGPLQDGQRAIQMVRERAAEWNVNPQRIGIMGFSAGGHLASTAGTHFNKEVILNGNKTNLRPNFMILGYPVISFQSEITHSGSKDNLIGKNPTQEKVDYYSNELQVTADTPPTFLFHASDDQAVKSENSIRFYQALVKNNVATEIHIYQSGGHGFGMNNKTTSDSWVDRLKNWMKANNWL
jgi:acetyl esterase/lipase